MNKYSSVLSCACWLFPCYLRVQTTLSQPLGGLVWALWALYSAWHTLLPWPDPDPGAQREEDDWEGESTGAIFAPISLSS